MRLWYLTIPYTQNVTNQPVPFLCSLVVRDFYDVYTNFLPDNDSKN